MMVAQPLHGTNIRAPDFSVNSQQADYGSYNEYPSSMSTAGSSSSVYQQAHSHPSSSTLPPTPMSASVSQEMPRSHSSGSHQWYEGGSITPPSAGGSESTPPYVRHPQQHPQWTRQQSHDTYTPLYAESQLVTPSTQPYHSGPMSSLPLIRPSLTSSISFPGPIFPSGSHPHMPGQAMPGFQLPLINVNGSGHGLGQSYDHHPGLDQKFHFGMPPPPVPHIYTGTEAQRHMYNLGPSGPGEGEWVGEWEDDEHPGEWYSGNMEIKHRRRTSPEQLKVLEHWFDINSKPDNALREWLAGELGMTKRNVQVWFQNRRAKIKGQHIKDKAAMEKAAREAESQKTPEGQITPARPSPFTATTPPEHPFPQALREKAEAELYANVRTASMLPPTSDRNLNIPAPASLPHGGRRVSLANGEAKEIQMWAAKRSGSVSGPSTGAAPKSPVIGQAAAARRGSIPYPTPLSAVDSSRPLTSSPKFSPLVRPASSTLHLTAIRNNTRRASMPGAPQLPGPPQLLSSGPFTPPRIVSYPVTGLPSVLSSIKDNDHESSPSDIPNFYAGTDPLPTTFISPTESTYSGGYPLSLSASTSSSGPGSYRPPQSTEQYNLNGPLPSPAFSFGNSGNAASGVQLPDEEAQRQQALFESFHRGRMGSVASIGSAGTLFSDGTGGTSGTIEEGDFDGPFNANRRASAPTGLLDFGLLGLEAFPNNGLPLRPSPLGIGNGFTAAEPSLPPTYGHPSQGNMHSQLQLSIPASGSHEHLSPHSSAGPSMHASPVDMGSCLSAAPSRQSHSPNSPIRLSPSHTGTYQSVPSQDRRFPVGLDESLWDFVGEQGQSEGFSMLVPTQPGSAPLSSHSSAGQQQQGLMAPVYIPGKSNSVSPS